MLTITIIVLQAPVTDDSSDLLTRLGFFAVLVTAGVAMRCGVFLPLEILRWLARQRGAKRLSADVGSVTLGLGSFAEQAAAASKKNRVSLCVKCAYSHVLRGFEAGEVSVTCGYSFPPREVLIAVKECSDYKCKRERIGVGIANEGAVNYPPLVKQAANSRAAAAVSPSVRE
jgi:hypothetical protein